MINMRKPGRTGVTPAEVSISDSVPGQDKPGLRLVKKFMPVCEEINASSSSIYAYSCDSLHSML